MDKAEKNGSGRPPRYYLQILRLMWTRHPWLTLAIAVTGAVEGFTAIAMVDTINSAIHDAGNRPYLIMVFAGLFVAIVLSQNLSNILPIYASREISVSLRAALSRKILATPLEEIERRGVPNVLSLLQNDIPQLIGTLLLLPRILVLVATLMFGLAYLAYLSSALLLLTITLVPLGLLFFRWIMGNAMRLVREARAEAIAFNGYVLSLLFGIKELQLNRDRRRWFKKAGFEFSSRKIANLQFWQAIWFGGARNVDEFVYFAVVGAFLFGVTAYFPISASVLTASILALMYVLGPSRTLVDMVQDLGQCEVACERLDDFGFSMTSGDVAQLLSDRSESSKTPAATWQTIELEGVGMVYTDSDSSGDRHAGPMPAPPDEDGRTASSLNLLNDLGSGPMDEGPGSPMFFSGPPGPQFSFKPGRGSGKPPPAGFELGPINLRLHPGEVIFVIGDNGSGKSTLAKVITGLYAPTRGRILLDGKPVDESNKERYRSLFTAVFTDFHLFDRIIGAHRQPPDPALATEYLGKLGLAEKIQIDGNRFSTTTALSNGQRKRLALLCAYMEDRPIYVLDEWAAEQDPGFKKFFYEELLSDLKAQGKCVIVITHDDRYFALADRTVRLDAGHASTDSDDARTDCAALIRM